MKKNKDIVLIVGGNFVNKGAQLMIDTVIHVLKTYYPTVTPIIIDSFPIKSKNFHYLNVEVISLPTYINFMYAMFRFKNFSPRFILSVIYRCLLSIKEGTFMLNFRNASKLLRLFRNARFVIDISGYGYRTDSGIMNYVQMVFADISSRYSIPYFYFPQSFGPFKENNKKERKINSQISQVITTASRIFARENKSVIEIAKLHEIKQVMYWPDIALLYAPLYQHKDEKIDYLDKISDSILIIPNARLNDKFNESRMLQFYINLISFLIKKGYKVSVIRHSADDAPIITKINNLIKKNNLLPDESVFILNKNLEPKIISQFICASKIVISGRYHGLVVALKHSVPCIAIGWSHKYDELMKLYNLEKYNIDLTLNPEENNYFKIILDAIENRDKLSLNIREKNNYLLSKFPIELFLNYSIGSLLS